MNVTQIAFPLPADVLTRIDSFRRRRACRDKASHERRRLYLAQKWAHSLQRKAVVLREDVWILIPLDCDFPDGEFYYAAYFREVFAWFRARGV